jgi:hypothetical protein
MQNAEKPLDPAGALNPVEEIENILKRLTPSAMSDNAKSSTLAMIDDLVNEETGAVKRASKRRHWWQAGFAATFITGACFAFFGMELSFTKPQIVTNQTRSSQEIFDEILFDDDNGNLSSMVGYQEVITNEVIDVKNGFVIQAGVRKEGAFVEGVSEF